RHTWVGESVSPIWLSYSGRQPVASRRPPCRAAYVGVPPQLLVARPDQGRRLAGCPDRTAQESNLPPPPTILGRLGRQRGRERYRTLATPAARCPRFTGPVVD